MPPGAPRMAGGVSLLGTAPALSSPAETWQKPKASTAQSASLGLTLLLPSILLEFIFTMCENPLPSALGAAACLGDMGAQGALWDTGWEGKCSSQCAEQGQFLQLFLSLQSQRDISFPQQHLAAHCQLLPDRKTGPALSLGWISLCSGPFPPASFQGCSLC